MAMDTCVFVVAGACPGLEARVAALSAFYAPLGRVGCAVWSAAGLRVGVLCPGGPPPGPDALLVWGEEPPPGLRSAPELVQADDRPGSSTVRSPRPRP